MTLYWHYQLKQVRQAVLPLGGRWVRPRPLIAVTLVGPTNIYVEDALLDTGADDTVFPETAASQIGLDLRNAPAGSAAGVGMGAATIRYAVVALRITDGREQREWTAWVGFTTARLKQPLLGFAGFLQFSWPHFTATGKKSS